MGVINDFFHISGVTPWYKDKLNNKERGFLRAEADFLIKNGDRLSGPLLNESFRLLITLANKDFDLVTRLWFSEGFFDAKHDAVVGF